MKDLLHYIVAKKHHRFRKTVDWNLAEEYCAKGLTPIERMTDRFAVFYDILSGGNLAESEFMSCRDIGSKGHT